MKKEIIAEYTYELPEPTDEEIQKEIDAEGLTNVVMPEDVRKYIRKSIYKLYCEAMMKSKNTEAATQAVTVLRGKNDK